MRVRVGAPGSQRLHVHSRLRVGFPGGRGRDLF